MKEMLKPFLLRLIIFAALVSFLAAILAYLLPSGTVTRTLPFQVVFFMGMTWIITWYLIRATEKSFIKFVNAYMAVTGLKLLLLILVAVGYALLNRPDAVQFLAAFFMLYLLFTGFEVYTVLSLSRRQKRS